MIVKFRLVWWDKPVLSDAEQIECGRKIALVGKEPFVDEFLKSAGSESYKKDIEYTAEQKVRSLIFVLLMGIGIYLLGKGKVFLVILGFVLSLYFLSTAVSVLRLNLWLNELVKKYAAHVAKQSF